MSIEKKGWINHDYKNQIQLTYCTLIIYSYHIIVDQSASQIESMIIFSSNVNLRMSYPIQIPAITNEYLKQ